MSTTTEANTKTILHIFYNEHQSDWPLRYGETTLDSDGQVVDQRDLKRKPRAARFDEVRECGCGANGVQHLGWCTRQKQIYKHSLLKP